MIDDGSVGKIGELEVLVDAARCHLSTESNDINRNKKHGLPI